MKFVKGLSETLHGEITDFIDARVSHSPESDFNKHVYIDSDGELSIKLEHAEQLLIENELLKDTLYTEESTYYNRSAISIRQLSEQSTKDILSKVKLIETITKNLITGKEVFRFTYSLLTTNYRVNFRECDPNKSKLQWLLKEGFLPIVSLIIYQFYFTLQHFKSTLGSIEFDKLCNNFSKTQATKPNKNKKLPY